MNVQKVIEKVIDLRIAYDEVEGKLTEAELAIGNLIDLKEQLSEPEPWRFSEDAGWLRQRYRTEKRTESLYKDIIKSICTYYPNHTRGQVIDVLYDFVTHTYTFRGNKTYSFSIVTAAYKVEQCWGDIQAEIRNSTAAAIEDDD